MPNDETSNGSKYLGKQCVVAEVDNVNLKLIRENVRHFLSRSGKLLDRPGIQVLDIAPQIHEGAKPHFPKAQVKTLDIDPKSSADFIADLCCDNSERIPDSIFDVVVCTEVLEHVLNPFAAVKEMFRILKPRGTLLASSPFNFRIHGPLPDCWRFTEHGWRVLLGEFCGLEIQPLEDPDRFLAPIHYTVMAKKPL